MGPTTAALLRFFQADQAYIEAKHKLDAATKNVRIQQGKVQQLQAEYDTAHTAAVSLEAKGREMESELKAREARIELLRQRQQNATNQKEYQALIVEINTQKVDKGKIEEQALGQIEQVETQKKAAAELKARLDAEAAKHGQMASEIDQRVQELTAQVAALKGPRDALAEKLPPAAIHAYQRASDRYEGEAMACIEKPDPRDQEYLCTGCNTYLVADIYNRLRSAKDEIVICPSCMRVLFIPEDLTPEKALAKRAARGDLKPAGEKPKRAPRKKKDPAAAAAAAAEPGSVAAALAAGAASATGKGPKDRRKAQAPPLPSTADGVSNTAADTVESPEQPEPENPPAEASASEPADEQTSAT